ncbi:uncharacterized protein LOC131023376 [Salvia miltiorrhiza]|uniref:uncharacterized protein LOC131023376 n=1 Tax=Salvia miltiorrhiza TaxID=226208 RepID=UPI0025ABAA7D|nr:uncharacterized protein LOC131023376 [Salvia miltiorrhiza]
MSELCSSKCHFSSLIISDLILLCSFILSHPLYFSYFIFFSPYLFTLISFLSPLFLTTSLLFLAFLVHTQTRFTSILESLQFNKLDHPNEEEPQRYDDLGIYDILFCPPSMAAVTEETPSPSQISDQTPPKDQILELNSLPGPDEEAPIAVTGKFEDSGEEKVSETPPCGGVVMEEKRLENFLKILDEFERLASNAEEKKQPLPRSAKSDKAVEKQKSLFVNGSEAAACVNNNSNRIGSKSQSHDQQSLSSYGSMRREREWKRTLACKLFEDRHNGGGGEGMDSLWEAYEVESSKTSRKREKIEVEMEEDDEVGGNLCCLQALKMSAGKMNLGVGRPNLLKISKAIKGIGWLHSRTKNSKKVHNNGDHRY